MAVSELAHRRMFEQLGGDSERGIWTWQLLSTLGQSGIQPDDPRIRSAIAGLQDPYGQPTQISYAQFVEVAQHSDGIVERTLQGELAISQADFRELVAGAEEIYAGLLDEHSGEVADYIPSLANVPHPDAFGIVICTVDGQRYSIGDSNVPFSVQSTSKPYTYGLALSGSDPQTVHRWVGEEQSGGVFNDPRLSLTIDGKPQNPMINAGAIATLALVEPELRIDARFEKVKDMWTSMMGVPPGSDTTTFLGERETGFGNIGLANQMAGKGMLHPGRGGLVSPEEAAELYFIVCGLEMDAHGLSGAGATLANGGQSPFTGKQVFTEANNGLVLSMMDHSGMYNGSGSFRNRVGLPAKSGVSGNVVAVVPGRFAIVTYSPRLDQAGNSVRGVKVCEQMVDRFGLNPYRNLGAGRGRSGPETAANQDAALQDTMRIALGAAGWGQQGGPSEARPGRHAQGASAARQKPGSQQL